MKFKFCRQCGSEAVEKWSGWYNQETGEKIYYSVCSKDPCHTEHKQMPYKPFVPFTPDWKCERCGKTGYWFIGY